MLNSKNRSAPPEATSAHDAPGIERRTRADWIGCQDKGAHAYVHPQHRKVLEANSMQSANRKNLFYVRTPIRESAQVSRTRLVYGGRTRDVTRQESLGSSQDRFGEARRQLACPGNHKKHQPVADKDVRAQERWSDEGGRSWMRMIGADAE